MCDNEVKIDSPVSRTLWSRDSPVSRTPESFSIFRKYDSPVSRTLWSRDSPVSRTNLDLLWKYDSPVSWTPGSQLKSQISPRKFVRIRNGPRASLMGPGGADL